MSCLVGDDVPRRYRRRHTQCARYERKYKDRFVVLLLLYCTTIIDTFTSGMSVGQDISASHNRKNVVSDQTRYGAILFGW